MIEPFPRDIQPLPDSVGVPIYIRVFASLARPLHHGRTDASPQGRDTQANGHSRQWSNASVEGRLEL